MVMGRFAALRQPDFSRRIDNAGAFRPERTPIMGPMKRESARTSNALKAKL